MRKSYDGLSALVKNKLEEDPRSNQLFVFVNQKGNQCKVLYFDRSGYCIWSKRLEQGQFHSNSHQFIPTHTNAGNSIKQTLSLTDLKLIIEGIDTRSVRQYEIIDHKNTYRLAQRPGSYVVLQYQRDVVRHKPSQTLTTIAAPSGLFDRSFADVSFIAGMLVDYMLVDYMLVDKSAHSE